MKNTILVLFSLLLVIACSKKESEKNLHITGNIKGLNKGTLYIKNIKDTAFVTIDIIKINGNSTFETDIDIKSPEMLYLFLDRGTSNTMDNRLSFFAEPGKINIDTDLEYFYAEAKITGSKNQELYDEYKKISSRFNEQQLNLTEEKINAQIKNKTPLLAENQEKSNALLKRKYLYAINFAVNNREYEVAPYIALSEISDATTTYLDTIQKSMSPRVASSKYGVMLTKYVAERKKEESK